MRTLGDWTWSNRWWTRITGAACFNWTNMQSKKMRYQQYTQVMEWLWVFFFFHDLEVFGSSTFLRFMIPFLYFDGKSPTVNQRRRKKSAKECELRAEFPFHISNASCLRRRTLYSIRKIRFLLLAISRPQIPMLHLSVWLSCSELFLLLLSRHSTDHSIAPTAWNKFTRRSWPVKRPKASACYKLKN